MFRCFFIYWNLCTVYSIQIYFLKNRMTLTLSIFFIRNFLNKVGRTMLVWKYTRINSYYSFIYDIIQALLEQIYSQATTWNWLFSFWSNRFDCWSFSFNILTHFKILKRWCLILRCWIWILNLLCVLHTKVTKHTIFSFSLLLLSIINSRTLCVLLLHLIATKWTILIGSNFSFFHSWSITL